MDELDATGSVGGADVTFDADGVPTIRLSGEIDMSNVDALRRTIEPIVARAPEHVVFDMSTLSFMDSSGIALLLQVTAKSKTVRVREPSALVKRMIDATGLTDILVVEAE
jgi:anti-sigma B factor antagonist